MTGIAGYPRDDITGVVLPSVEFTAEAGAIVEIDWDDGNGFVAAATGTGAAQQEMLASAYTTNGVKNIQVQATDNAGNVDIQSLSVEIVGIGPDVFNGSAANDASTLS